MAKRYVIKKFEELKESPQPSGVMLRLVGLSLDARHVAMSVTVLKPGQGIELHTHETSEEIYVLAKGRSQLLVDDETRDVEAVTTARFLSGTMYGVNNNSKEDALWFFIGAPIDEYLDIYKRKFGYTLPSSG